ncbi:hypothetical protein CEW83_20500 [Parazoarcus communis]|uniref:Virulence sensor protein BvgS n=1 Tax=Parazoarcus communis TaxID=41977 RepID=A0A2U8GUF4_9RHOO|nr:PAS domain-containing protein [Parazoarcus communis]AWI77322.1 hypothetical protein CEW83_20500 [Parazoarcus communis]
MEADPSATATDSDSRALRRATWRVVLPYALFASVWIVLSDRALDLLPESIADKAWLQTFKGWFFVFITSLLLYGVVRDMLLRLTEASRRRHEEQRSRLQAARLLSAIADSSSDAIFAKDLRGRYLLFNKAATDFVGKDADEVLGHDDRVLFPPAYAQMVMANDQQVMAAGETMSFEETVRLPDREVTYLATKGVLRGASGEVTGMYGISRDISALKAVEFELRKLSQVVEQSPESVLVTDLEGRVEYVNETFTVHSGYLPAEVLGQPASMFGEALTPASSFEELWAALSRGEAWSGEFINQRKDGSSYAVFARVVPIRREDGSISNYMSLQEDITEKKRIEAELEQHRKHLEELVSSRTAELRDATERANAASEAKSAFLANMSHEIRTPMNAIIGLTHLLRRDHPAQRQIERLDRVGTAARHLLSVINDILDLSKIEAGRLRLESGEFALGAVFEHVQSLIAEQAKAKGLTVELDTRDVPGRLCGDATRLRQALLNYAVNAIKFTEHGSVSLSASVAEDRGDALLVRFEVTDTGMGVAADKIPRLFDAFEQADASTTRRFGGTGLGLAITRRLATLMGGEAGAESEPGHGSTFWFTAVLRRGRGAVANPPSVSAGESERVLREQHAGAHVLLAEDNPVNREVALDLLSAVGLAVESVSTGRAVLERCRTSDFDLILMDMRMPEMDGLAATRALRAQTRNRHTPVVALTANVFEEDRRACFAAGMDDFVAKPVDPQDLYSTLLRWLPPRAVAGAAAAQASVPAEPTSAERAPEVIEAAVAQMKLYLANANMRANRLLEDERRVFATVLGSVFSEFEHNVACFRYPEALALLAQCRTPGRD